MLKFVADPQLAATMGERSRGRAEKVYDVELVNRTLLYEMDLLRHSGRPSTPGAPIELGAVERLLGDHASKATMSSTKSATGHLLGAAGAIEAIFSILAIRDQVAPPTINLDNVAVETSVDLAPNAKVEREINVALSNSFGFGGTNASLVFERHGKYSSAVG